MSRFRSYLVKALQPPLDLSHCRVHTANFDLWVLPLCVHTYSDNFAIVTVKKKERESHVSCTI